MPAGTLLLTLALIQAASTGPLETLDREPVAVEGRVELSPGEADASAKACAVQLVRWELERRGAATLEATRPIWLPGFVGEGLVSDWLRRTRLERAFDVVHSARETRSHGNYVSYQTTLQVATDPSAIDGMLTDLRRRIQVGARRFSWLLAGTAGLWVFLSLVYGWLDRLTRGYMPWRLRTICVGMGLLAPGIALLFL